MIVLLSSFSYDTHLGIQKKIKNKKKNSKTNSKDDEIRVELTLITLNLFSDIFCI